MIGFLKPVGIVVGVVGLLVLLGYGSLENAKTREAKRNTWRTIRSGEFARAEFGVRHVEKLHDEYGIGRDSGARWRYRTAKEDITTIFFRDGSSLVLDGQVETPFATGAIIVISENGLGERSVIEVLSAKAA